MVHFDATLGRHAHTGFTAGGERPIGLDALRRAGITVLVGGRRYGKGSSREHSPLAEQAAGVRLVIAESFERIYRQNADNLGLLTSTDLGLLDRLQRGEWPTLDELLADREPLAAAIVRAGGLLRYGLGPEAPLPPPARGPQTLFDKIVARHRVRPGFVRADWRFIHEYYTGMAAHLLQAQAGDALQLLDPGSILCFEDHLSYVDESPVHLSQGLVQPARALGTAHRAFAQRHGLQDFGPLPAGPGSQGISHALVAERYALPGQLVVGTDSHTPHSGALGCVAFGVGTTEMANAFVTGAVRLGMPQVLRVEVDGQLPPGVTAKDLVLHLLALPAIRAGAGVGRVFEFGGAAVRAMGIDERATLTNMTAELGGLTGIVEPDQRTCAFLPSGAASRSCSRTGCTATRCALCRHACAWTPPRCRRWWRGPATPGWACRWRTGRRPRIDIAYGGSCTAGKREDFDQYHAVLAWACAARPARGSGRQAVPAVRHRRTCATTASSRAGCTFDAVGARCCSRPAAPAPTAGRARPRRRPGDRERHQPQLSRPLGARPGLAGQPGHRGGQRHRRASCCRLPNWWPNAAERQRHAKRGKVASQARASSSVANTR
jgi:3-isopropylmalate/(R)-2-methylmalate dehydratase large subunit